MIIESKVCFKCPEKGEQPLSNFYKHPKMPDGHLNKCKDCTKKDTAENTNKKKGNPEFIEKERERGRKKYRRLYSKALKSYVHEIKDGLTYSERYPEKYKAANASSYLKPYIEGTERHHWSYNEEHFRDLIWLKKKDHMNAHRYIIYDQERKMYRRYDTNELLDTKERHEQFIRYCIENRTN